MPTYKEEYRKRVEGVYGESFDWGGAAKRLAAGVIGAPADALLLMSYMAYLGGKISTEQLMLDFDSLEPYTLEGLSKEWGAPDEGLASYADWLTLGLGGVSKIVQKSAKKPMRKAITEHLLNKGKVDNPTIKKSIIDFSEKRDIALAKKKQKDVVKSKLSDEEDLSNHPGDPDRDPNWDYTEQERVQDAQYEAWKNDYHAEPSILEGKKVAEFTVKKREQKLQKIFPSKKSPDSMTDEEMWAQMDEGFLENDFASPTIDATLPGENRKIIQFNPKKKNNVPVVFQKSTHRRGGKPDGDPVMAYFDHKANEIIIDPELALQKYNEKAWLKPKVPGVRALPEDSFATYKDWERFLVEHEQAHTRLPRLKDEAYPDYENRMNDEAFKVIGKRSKYKKKI